MTQSLCTAPISNMDEKQLGLRSVDVPHRREDKKVLIFLGDAELWKSAKQRGAEGLDNHK